MSLCQHCGNAPIPPKNRRYCQACSPQASRIWKARKRKQWRREWRENGQAGPPPYLDDWPSRDAYRAYYRLYMRDRRRRLKEAHRSAGPSTNP